MNETTADDQCEFRSNKSIIYQIFPIRQVLKKKWVYDGSVRQLFGTLGRHVTHNGGSV